MGSTDKGSFTAPPQQVTFDGLLFDMDGTIIDSTSAVEKHWHTVGDEIGADPKVILETSHGRRSIDVLRILAPEKANWAYVRQMEGVLPEKYGDEAKEIPGARPLLDSLMSKHVRWAIVTSGTEPLVKGWLGVLGLPIPRKDLLITAESVDLGKPHPSCYRLGRERLGLASPGRPGGDRGLVFEDSPAGIEAGKASGCKVIGVVTSHTLEQILDAKPDWVVRDLESVSVVEGSSSRVTLEIRDAYVMGTGA